MNINKYLNKCTKHIKNDVDTDIHKNIYTYIEFERNYNIFSNHHTQSNLILITNISCRLLSAK